MSKNNEMPLRISVQEHEKFNDVVRTDLTTTQKISRRINQLFNSAFADYYGCVVRVNNGQGNTTPQAVFSVELYFKPVNENAESDGRIIAFKPIGHSDASIYDQLQAISSTFNQSNKFDLTSEASQILSWYLHPGMNLDPFRPEQYKKAGLISEFENRNMGYGYPVVMTKVSGIDLIKLVKDIYGHKNDSGSQVEYNVVPLRPLSANPNAQYMGLVNWLIMIQQADKNNTSQIASDFGYVPTTGDIPIETGLN